MKTTAIATFTPVWKSATARPGLDMTNIDKPEAVADAIVPLCLPEMTETGKYYDFSARKLVDFRRPGES